MDIKEMTSKEPIKTAPSAKPSDTAKTATGKPVYSDWAAI